MKVLDLFSGIGGFSLGLESTGFFQTVGFCEIDPFCRLVLKKHWPEVPIYDDVRTLDPSGLGRIDVICGGYPCQPFSTAGKRGGADDDRHLWPEMFRLIKSVRPRWVICENVAGHINLGLDNVLSDLESENYTWWTFVIPACAVGARHRRDRVWIVAHSNSEYGRGLRCGIIGQEGAKEKRSSQNDDAAPPSDRPETLAGSDSQREQQQEGLERHFGGRAINSRENVADSDHQGLQRRLQDGKTYPEGRQKPGARYVAECSPERGGSGNSGRKPKSGMGRAFNGFSFELDPDRLGTPRVNKQVKDRAKRLKALGNAVVPQIIYNIGNLIKEEA